jgi:hypothetical protein
MSRMGTFPKVPPFGHSTEKPRFEKGGTLGNVPCIMEQR